MEFFGDLGGFLEIMKFIGGILVGGLSNLALDSKLASLLFIIRPRSEKRDN